MKTSVAILFGGASSEHEVSCVSAANIADNIDTEKYEIYRLGITRDGVWFLYAGSTDRMRDGSWIDDKANLAPAFISTCAAHHGFIRLDKAAHTYEIIRVDVVFPVLHGKNGEDGTMQGMLEIAGIPYVGCDTLSSASSMDKAVAKLIAASVEVPVTPSLCAKNTPDFDINALVAETEEVFDYPVFVKPCNAGSSVGVTKAKNRAELVSGIVAAFGQDKKLLIEPFMRGKEIEVAVLGNETAFASPCGEITANADFYDYDTKYKADTAEYHIPARIDGELADRIRDAAVKVYGALGCDGLARVDFFADTDSFVFNEINTIPGFTPISMYPSLMKSAGISYSELISKLISLALERKA